MPQATCVEICLEEPRKLFLPRGIKIKMGPLFKMHRKWNKWINIHILSIAHDVLFCLSKCANISFIGALEPLCPILVHNVNMKLCNII